MKYIVIVLSILVTTFSNAQSSKETEKIGVVLDYIDKFYVQEVNEEEIVEKVIKNTLKELDPHSVYISKKEVEEMNEPLVGNFEGVGIQFNILNDTIFVVATIAGGPSEKVGILAGDKIVTIDNENVYGAEITNRDVIDRLRGEKGTEVTVEIKRSNTNRLLAFDITRDKIPLYSVDAAYMATPEIGYIKVNRFAAKTPLEFKTALYKLKEQGMKSLIVDLQGNSGGYLNAAFQMVDEFLDSGKLIVYTEGENSERNDMKATAYGNYEEGNLIVLIDQFSASASEILSGAVQDWDRGLVVGRRSFGKGLVQRPFSLPDGSQIRLTIANYYTPSGRFIQKPYEDGSDSYRKDIIDRYESGELTDDIKKEYPDSLKFKTANGRTVYGGGGITPDIFVPLDTTQNSDYYSEVRSKGLLNKFALNYIDKNRAMLTEFYSDVETFNNNFEYKGEFFDSFIEYATNEGVINNESDLIKSNKVIGIQLKALVARNIFDGEAFYYIYNKNLDATYNKAIELIEKNEFAKHNIEWTKK